MNFRLISVEEITLLHDSVLNEGELKGLAKDKSINGALSRIEFRIQYGMISDVYDLAAMYAVAISQAHIFNDGNKRTAHAAMKFVIKMHGEALPLSAKQVGDIIIKTAQGQLDETELADWLRSCSKV